MAAPLGLAGDERARLASDLARLARAGELADRRGRHVEGGELVDQEADATGSGCSWTR